MRTRFAPSSRKHRKRVLERAKGFYGASSKLIRTAYDAVDRANANAYIGRKQKKRQYRNLWTIRINAACRMRGMSYSVFIHGLKLSNMDINRKMLSEMAIHDEKAFDAVFAIAKSAAAAAAPAIAPATVA